jgi:spermidine/putrescine transport system permease protein
MSRHESVMASRRGHGLLRGWFVFFLLFLYLPTALLILFSFNDAEAPQFPIEGLTLRWYEDSWNTPAIRDSVRNSVVVALGTSIIATSLGVASSYALARRRFRGRNAVFAILVLPLVVPYIVLGIALLTLFLRGPVDISLSLWTVLAGHIVVALPFTILLLVPRIAAVDRRLEEAAQDLGASGLYTFRRVMLPLIFPAILSSFLIAFVVSIDEVVIASFVVGDQVTYPIYLFSGLRFSDRVMLLIPVGSVMIVVSFALVLLAEIIRRRGDRLAKTFPLVDTPVAQAEATT